MTSVIINNKKIGILEKIFKNLVFDQINKEKS